MPEETVATVLDEGQANGSLVEDIVGEGTEPVGSTEPIRFDIDQFGDQVLTITVNGIEQEVPVRELRDGFMRKQDYTRKTQTLAEQRSDLEQAQKLVAAIERDPAGTLKLLAAQFGVQASSDDYDEFDEPDPVNLKIQELDRELARIRERENSQAIDREVSELKSQYGVDDAELEDIFAEAMRRKVDLASAYRIIHFDDAFEAYNRVKARESEEAKILADKKRADVVHFGESATAGGSETQVITRPTSVKEAYMLAKQGIRYEGG